MKRQWGRMMAGMAILGLLCGCGASGGGTEETFARGRQETRALTDISGADQAKGEGGDGQTKTLTVFAAASLTETLTEIASMYREIRPDVELIFTFDSSGTLKTQIQEGADCDIFISAAQKQMDWLDGAAGAEVNPWGLDLVLEGTRLDLLENKVVLAVPDDNPAGVDGFEDLGGDGVGLISIGNEDVPVGAYSLEILTSLGILEQLEEESKLTYGSNVKEVTTQVKEGTVDCGIIYATDALGAGLTVADEAEEGWCRQVIYPAAVLKDSKEQEEAKAFLAYLSGSDAMAVFEAAGFSPIK